MEVYKSVARQLSHIVIRNGSHNFYSRFKILAKCSIEFVKVFSLYMLLDFGRSVSAGCYTQT